jgi:hypothetical protein
VGLNSISGNTQPLSVDGVPLLVILMHQEIADGNLLARRLLDLGSQQHRKRKHSVMQQRRFMVLLVENGVIH